MQKTKEISMLQNTRANIVLRNSLLVSLALEHQQRRKTGVAEGLFVDEFVNRDLFNVTDIDQLQWRMKGNKLTNIKVKEYLKSVAGRVALENLKTIQPQKIVDWFDLLNSSNSITDANIDYFVDTNFVNIFK